MILRPPKIERNVAADAGSRGWKVEELISVFRFAVKFRGGLVALNEFKSLVIRSDELYVDPAMLVKFTCPVKKSNIF